MNERANTFNFENSQMAWEFFNEGLFNNSDELINDSGAQRNSTELELHDVFIFIRNAKVNKKVDFGNYFGYRQQKWTGLVNNYIEINELESFKKEVETRESTNSKTYNISMHFRNIHGHGKGCLLTLTASRRVGYDKPIITVTMRSSEVTKRLLLDLLLIQRISEFIYGKKVKTSIQLFATKLYQNAESFAMYNNHIPFSEFDDGGQSEWQQKVRSILDKFLNCNINDIKYKVHKRSVRQLQRDKEGNPLSGNRPMLAKELLLFPHENDFHEYTEAQLKAFEVKKDKMRKLSNTINK